MLSVVWVILVVFVVYLGVHIFMAQNAGTFRISRPQWLTNHYVILFAGIFLLGLDFLEPRKWSEDQLERLTYVAITRARYQLFIPYVNQSALVKKLQAAL